ncbi:MAG: hypothetical protein Q9198_011172, partial [Flavoplaca austrocitrina]
MDPFNRIKHLSERSGCLSIIWFLYDIRGITIEFSNTDTLIEMIFVARPPLKKSAKRSESPLMTPLTTLLGLVKQSAGLPPIGLDTYAAGRIGLGFEELEAGVVRKNQTGYPSIVSELVANGFIETKAYSLWLGST